MAPSLKGMMMIASNFDYVNAVAQYMRESSVRFHHSVFFDVFSMFLMFCGFIIFSYSLFLSFLYLKKYFKQKKITDLKESIPIFILVAIGGYMFDAGYFLFNSEKYVHSISRSYYDLDARVDIILLLSDKEPTIKQKLLASETYIACEGGDHHKEPTCEKDAYLRMLKEKMGV